MKKISILWFLLAVFGGISAYEVITRFGWQAVDLPPAKFFWFSLWAAVRNFTTYTLAFLALPFLFGRKARYLLIPIALWVVLVEGMLYVGKIFHADVAAVWFDLVRETNFEETKNFVMMFLSPLSAVLTVVAVGLLVVMSVGFWRMRYPKFSFRNFGIGVALLLPFFVFNFLLMNWHSGVAQMEYSSFVIATAKSYLDKGGVRNACLNPQLPEKVETTVSADRLPDVVLVIGESATRNNWNLYGYPRSTTPRTNEICHRGGVYYSDVITTQPDTVNVLNLFMTDVMFDDTANGNWTLAEVYRRAGYRCVLISQQYSDNPNTSMYQLFNGCEQRINVQAECKGRKAWDEDVVPILERELGSDDARPVFAIVHLAGMHFPVQNVIPEAENYFTDQVEPQVLEGLSDKDRDRRNRYDSAIRYEDKVLGMVVDAISKRKKPSCMFFCSDHGESPRAAFWRDYEDKDIYEIPTIFWFSSEYHQAFPETVAACVQAKDRKFQQDELTVGLLSLGCIRFWNDSLPGKSFLSPDFRPRSPRFMNKGRIKCL